jgi:hypothetical protein
MRTNLLFIAGSERLILSWDPSQLILTREYELGFQEWLQGRGQESVYIALRVQREPLNQTDLKNGVDTTLGGGGGTFWKRADSGAHRGAGGIMVGPTGPTWQPLGVRRGVVSSGVLWNLLE